MGDDLRSRFAYHAPRGNQTALYEANRAAYIRLAEHLAALGKPSRELSLALTALQESLMWANAHIACNDVGVDDAPTD